MVNSARRKSQDENRNKFKVLKNLNRKSMENALNYENCKISII